MSNSKFIEIINEQIGKSISKFTGFRIFGLAQSIIRKRSDGNSELLPALVDRDGEGLYIGLDDVCPITIYHKSNSISVTEKANSGYGDSRSHKINVFSNAMIIALDRKATNLLPDEIVLLIQAILPDEIKGFPDFKSINIRIQNIILNTQQVFASEYQNVEYMVPLRFSLFAINYQIESVFDKNCFATCP